MAIIRKSKREKQCFDSIRDAFNGETKGKKKRAKPRPLESNFQISCTTWFRLEYPRYKLLLFAVPNGGSRHKAEAKRLKDEGVIPGVSDKMLLIPRHGYHALCIEFKVGKGEQSDFQIAWQKAVEAQGYKYIIPRSIDEFMKEINEYLK